MNCPSYSKSDRASQEKERTLHFGADDYVCVGEASQSVEGSLQETDNEA
jgi:hypothetical protein